MSGNNLPQRNPNFQPRDPYAATIAQQLKEHSLAVVSGVAGCGKTQIVKAFGHDNVANYQLLWYITADKHQQEMKELGAALKVKNSDKLPARELVDQVWVALAKRTPKNWLIIFDGFVSQEAFKMQLHGHDLPSREDAAGLAHVIVVTRAATWPDAAPINVGLFSDAEASAFLNKHLSTEPEADRKLLASTLINFPLALTQAAAHILTPKTTIKAYIKSIDDSKSFGAVQDRTLLDGYASTVENLVTSQHALLSKSQKQSAVLLDHICIVSGAAISLATLRSLAAFSSLSEAEVTKVLAPCVEYGFLETVKRGTETEYRMPLLFGKVLMWSIAGIAANATSWLPFLEENFQVERPTTDPLQKAQAELLPAADFILDAFYKGRPAASDKDTVVGKQEWLEFAARAKGVADAARITGKNDLALKWYQKGLEIRKIHLEAKDLVLATSYYFVGISMTQMRQFGPATEALNQALAIQKEILGNNHSTVALTIYKLGNVSIKNSKAAQALKLYEEAEAIQRVANPPVPVELADTLNNIAGLFGSQKKEEKAIELYLECLELRRHALGRNSVSVSITLFNLGELYDKLNKRSEAKQVYTERLEVLKNNSDSDPASIAEAAYSLGKMYKSEEKIDVALSYLRDSLQRYRDASGDNNLNIAKCLHDIADCQIKRKEFDDALVTLNDENQTLQRCSGKVESEIGTCKYLLGVLHYDKEDFKSALPFLDDALKSQKTKGASTAAVASTQLMIGACRIAQDNESGAQEALQDSLRIFKTLKDPNQNYPHFARTQYLLGSLLFDQGKFTEALELFQGHNNACNKCPGDKRKEIAEGLLSLCFVQCALRNNQAAHQLAKEAISIREQFYGPEHEETVAASTTANNIRTCIEKLYC